MAKTAATARKHYEHSPWVLEWCKAHVAEVADCRGKTMAMHDLFGILFAHENPDQVYVLMGCLRKKVRRDVEVVDADAMLALLSGPSEEPLPERHDPPPPLSRVTDPFDNDLIIDGASRPEPAPAFDSSGSLGPFPSPDKQPPFQPRRPPSPGFDRGVLIDGGGAAWRNRGLRYD